MRRTKKQNEEVRDTLVLLGDPIAIAHKKYCRLYSENPLISFKEDYIYFTKGDLSNNYLYFRETLFIKLLENGVRPRNFNTYFLPKK